MPVALPFRRSATPGRTRRRPCRIRVRAAALPVLLVVLRVLAARADVLDRVVAVVNNHAILLSDVDEEVRLAAIEPGGESPGILTRRHALDQLIGRALVEQQMRQEDMQATESTPAEIEDRLKEIRNQLPACVRASCATEEGWKAFLSANNLTIAQVEASLRYRLRILNFIEQRFRQGISVSDREIEEYYRNTLLPEYARPADIPPLEKVSGRIQEILLQQKVNVLFDEWLRNLRSQGDVEVLDPSLEDPGEEAEPSRQDRNKEGAPQSLLPDAGRPEAAPALGGGR